jgi:hypothetical protein
VKQQFIGGPLFIVTSALSFSFETHFFGLPPQHHQLLHFELAEGGEKREEERGTVGNNVQISSWEQAGSPRAKGANKSCGAKCYLCLLTFEFFPNICCRAYPRAFPGGRRGGPWVVMLLFSLSLLALPFSIHIELLVLHDHQVLVLRAGILQAFVGIGDSFESLLGLLKDSWGTRCAPESSSKTFE